MIKTQKVIFLTFLIKFCCLTLGYSQQAVVSSGKNASGSNGSVSFSVGQVFYNLHTGHNGNVSEGVQQPYEIFVVTSLPEFKNIKLTCLAYPNPVRNSLNLWVKNAEGISYQLYDLNGKVIFADTVKGSETVISMNDLVPAMYFLKVLMHNVEVKTFKIIKR